MAPVAELTDNPAGKAPLTRLKEYGIKPFAAVRLPLYGIPTVPEDSDAVNVTGLYTGKAAVAVAAR